MKTQRERLDRIRELKTLLSVKNLTQEQTQPLRAELDALQSEYETIKKENSMKRNKSKAAKAKEPKSDRAMLEVVVWGAEPTDKQKAWDSNEKSKAVTHANMWINFCLPTEDGTRVQDLPVDEQTKRILFQEKGFKVKSYKSDPDKWFIATPSYTMGRGNGKSFTRYIHGMTAGVKESLISKIKALIAGNGLFKVRMPHEIT